MPSESKPPYFTASQWRVISTALMLLAIGTVAALLVFALSLIGEFLSFFSGVLWPLAVAGVLALILRPVVVVLQHRLHLQRAAAVVLLYGVVVLLCAATLLIVVPPVFSQILDFLDYAPSLWANGRGYVEQHYPQWVAIVERQLANPTVHRVAEKLLTEFNAMLQHALPSLRAAGGGLLGIFVFGAHLVVIPIYLFFFLLAKGGAIEKLHPNLPFLAPNVRQDVVFLVREFVGIVEAFFRGQLLIGLILGVLLALGFSLIGLKFGLVLGLVFGVLNIIPYFGTILGLAVTLPLAFLQPDGGWHLVGWVLVVYSVVQATEGWVLTPRIMGSQTGLHPVAIMVAILFWGTAFQGVLGMLLAIPLTAFFVTVWRLAKRKYFKSHA
ncbi:MAG: AI-2E family transporter [Opitutaceae bacterium]